MKLRIGYSLAIPYCMARGARNFPCRVEAPLDASRWRPAGESMWIHATKPLKSANILLTAEYSIAQDFKPLRSTRGSTPGLPMLTSKLE